MERETNGIKGKTNEKKEETDEKRLTIIRVAYVIEMTSAILNTSSSNRTVAPRQLFQRDCRLK